MAQAEDKLKDNDLEQVTGGSGDRTNQYEVMMNKRREAIAKVKEILAGGKKPDDDEHE